MINFENFIMEMDNFVTDDYCDEVISYFNRMRDAGFSFTRTYTEKHKVSDTAIALHDHLTLKLTGTGELNKIFVDNFWETAYEAYAKEYSVLKNFEYHSIFFTKIQKSKIGEGYHIWHCEDANRHDTGRILTYVLYLNDVHLGGETEFLYYPKRVKAKKGTLVLFPAGFTHTHRGNPPISNEKYVITGWVEY